MYKDLLKLTSKNKTKKTQLKNGPKWNKHILTKEDIQKADKHMESS